MDDDTTAKVRERAFLIWESEGQPHGQHDEHWTRAQGEIAHEKTKDGATEMAGSGAKPEVDKTTDVKVTKTVETKTARAPKNETTTTRAAKSA